MKTLNKPTYISLFSSAGIGCYGFKLEGFECIATNELITRRLEIQKFNKKCKYESGYICGDITEESTKNALYDQISLWKKKEGLSRVDVVVATPPCQGMSVANHKKSETEIIRNSLVIESIKIIKQINPRFFIFENVPAFMKTICTDIDGEHKSIAAAIENNLGQAYSYTSRVINFKNFGACSSRQRTVVIGVSKDFADEVSPIELYPDLLKERTLREVIGHLKHLKEFGEIDKCDIYHSFRPYPEHMRAWIADIKEGQSAFDNVDDSKKPHRIVDGKIVINQRKNADKYTRQYWDKVGPCIHTRNDQMASQNTVHPCDDRVFSIRELMLMMTVPYSFKWVETDLEVLNSLSTEQKRAFLKKEEIKIRQSLGEAVPTAIFQSIAKKISEALKHPPLKTATINKVVSSNKLSEVDNLKNFIVDNPMDLSAATLGKIAEMANTSRTDNAAFFTSKTLITEMMKALPDTDKETVRILEPSVGVGNFLPLIIKKFEGKRIILDVVDIDKHSLEFAELILKNYNIPDTCTINYIHDDFLLHNFEERYDYIIGNPPFFKMKSSNKLLNIYRRNAINKATTNICSFFLDKAIHLGNYVALVFPKFLLNTPEFAPTRSYLSEKAVECIIDFGEKGFPGVLVETLAIFINNLARPSNTRVASITHGKYMSQSQKYIFDDKLPYWIIYRDMQFDSVCKKLDFNVFKVFRDRQITNSQLSDSGDIRVLKSRNISDDGKEVIDLSDYDSYIDYDALKELAVFEYLDRDDVYLTPNMTYKPRMMQKPKHCVVNGSLAILIPKNDTVPTEKQMEFFSTKEYREFSVSFIDGKKYDYSKAEQRKLRSVSDRICAEHGLSVIKNPHKAPTRQVWLDEKSGKPTRYNVYREDMREAIDYSRSPKYIEEYLQRKGYITDFTGKHWKIRLPQYEHFTRLDTLDERWTPENLKWSVGRYASFGSRRAYISYPKDMPQDLKDWFQPFHRTSHIYRLYLHYCYLLGYLPKNTDYKPTSPYLKEDLKNYKVDTRGTCESRHYIRADAIEQVVMLELRRMAMFLQSDEEAFADLLAQKTQKDIINEQKALQGELQRCTARNQKVAELYEKLYEDNVSGKVTDEWFMQLSHKYEVERMELKTKIATLNERINNLGTMQQNKDRFIGAIRRFMEMQKLTAPLLRELIDEITVYETKGVGKNRSQRIMIHYKFIGYIEIPECGSNYKADTRKGVAVEYITKSA